MTFTQACTQFHDHLITARALHDFLVTHHVWFIRLNLGLFEQVVNWCGGA